MVLLHSMVKLKPSWSVVGVAFSVGLAGGFSAAVLVDSMNLPEPRAEVITAWAETASALVVLVGLLLAVTTYRAERKKDRDARTHEREREFRGRSYAAADEALRALYEHKVRPGGVDSGLDREVGLELFGDLRLAGQLIYNGDDPTAHEVADRVLIAGSFVDFAIKPVGVLVAGRLHQHKILAATSKITERCEWTLRSYLTGYELADLPTWDEWPAYEEVGDWLAEHCADVPAVAVAPTAISPPTESGPTEDPQAPAEE